MEGRHRDETRELKNELEELNSEHEIELEMIKKEMEDLKLREERWKRAAELKKESDYDSSDLGSRDPSPEVEALKEQMAALHSNYEDEITVLKEKLQTQIVKATEAEEKVESQEFEFQESLSELKSAFERERNGLLTAHQEEIDQLKSEKTKLMETSANSSTEYPQKEQYENLIHQLQEQVTSLNSQLEEGDAQMAQDLMIMKNEFETQLEEARSGFESEKEQLEKTILELKSQAEDMNTKHLEDIEQLEQAFRREKEELLNASASQGNKEQDVDVEAMQRKIEEYKNEMKDLKENLQKERNEFIESRELLESMISEQERDFEEKEEKLREELNEIHQMKTEKIISDYEQRLQEAERSHLEGKDLDGEKRSIEELQLEIKTMQRTHEREIGRLNESLDNLQSENESLKTEFDLVVTDLSSELETTKKNGKPAINRKTSTHLKQQIEMMKVNQEEQIRMLGEDVESYKQKVAELEGEVERLKDWEEKTEADMDLQTKTVELEYELEVLREENQNNEAELEEYKKKVSELERELAQCKRGQEEDAEQEKHKQEISSLENQLGDAMKEKANSVAEAEEYKATVENLRRELGELNDVKYRLDSELTNYSSQLQRVNEELKSAEAKCGTLRETITNLEAEKQDLQDAMEKQSRENEIKSEKLSKNLEKIEQEKQAAIGNHKRSEEVAVELNNEIERLSHDCEKFRKEKDALLQEVQELREKATEGEDGTQKKIAQYEDKIEKMSAKIESLENYQKQSEIEKQDLEEEIENLRYSQEVEPMISAAAIDENFASNPASLGLEYEQQMKGLAEDYEEKIEKLEAELVTERSKSASNNRRMDSVNLEIEALRENLEEERLSVKNAQERLVKMQERHEEEIKSLKDQLRRSEMESRAKVSSNEEVVKEEFSKTIKTLEADLETALHANSQQVEQIADVKAQLEKAWHTNEMQEREITELNREVEELRLQQKEQEANSTAEQLMARDVHAKTIQVLKADLESARTLNKSQQEEITELRKELEEFQRQQIVRDASRTAEQLKTSEEHGKGVEALKADLDAARKLNTTREEEIVELKQELEDFQQQQIAHEANLTAEQLKISESQKTQKLELKKKMREIAALNSELESAQQTNRTQSEELSRIKVERDELQKARKRDEENSLTEQLKADEASARKIKALEEEVKRKTAEMTKLFAVLDTEQKGRERVLLETEKHLTQMHQAEQDKINSERLITELKSKNNELRGELIKEKEKFASYISQSEKVQFEEHEEVEKLSRSLTESEMDKGKLTDEIETCKDELNKMQEKYNKLKERFLALKQKRKEEKEKYDEILLTPRFEMGLQTSLLEPEDFNQTKEQLSSSMREQLRLEDELEILQRDMYKKKTETQALKRANEVLRKQNQVLYLETESLRKSGHIEGLDVPGIQKENEKLLQDKENLVIENRFLKEALSEREKQDDESQEKDNSLDKLLETELQELKENHVKLEQENSKLREENEFLLKQGKRLQSQVDQLEDQVKRLKRQTPLTSTPKTDAQPQSFVNEVIKSESGNQLNLESLPGSIGAAPPNASMEAQRFAEENQRIKEQVQVLQTRLRSKEKELQATNNSQTEAIDDLVNERKALLAQMESMKEALDKYDDVELAEKIDEKVQIEISLFSVCVGVMCA